MEDMKKIVSEAKMEDIEGIVSLLYQLSPRKPGESLDRETGQAILKSIIDNPDYCLCVAKINGELAGTALLLIQLNLSHGGKPYGHVENVVTDVSRRGKGIGLTMVNFLMSKARERGCYKVILDCEAKNIPFYERCGFSLTGESEMRFKPD
ncbi:MAG: GNAT family N-acetyltransferase [Candidatus Omnitrophica bacterium]|nr:GNAT family N-acetyltransferase [Candidatus Omnitrophota bacterium]